MTAITPAPRQGLLPDQIRYLKERLWVGALRQFRDAAKGNVHLPGNYVLRNLNLAFGPDGWSTEITKSYEVFKEKFDKEGKTLYRVIWVTEVRLTIHTPGGATFSRDGTGSDEGVSSSMVDCYKKAPAGALTYAIKNAAITLGDQFGLRVIRAGKDENAKPYNWRTRTQPNHPIPPDLTGVKAGDHDLTDDDDDDAMPVDGPLPEPERRAPEPERRAPEPERRAPEPERRAPEPERRAEPETGQGEPLDRGAIVTACRAAWSKLGRERAEPVFADVARRFAYSAPFVTIGRPPAVGGPSDVMLVALRGALEGVAQ